MQIGVGFYYPPEFESEGRTLVLAAKWFAQAFAPGRVRFAGMLAKTDRFSRARALNSKAEDHLRSTIDGREFSNLLLDIGAKEEPDAQFTLEIAPPEGVLYRFGSCRAVMDLEAVAGFLGSVSELIAILRIPYGFVVFGDSAVSVLSELEGVAVRHWREPRDPAVDERFGRIQYARPILGKHVRGAAWGMFLGPELVDALGGSTRVRQEAPVEIVEERPDGGVYLQMIQEPLELGEETYQILAARLEAYLSSVTPPEPPFRLRTIAELDQEFGNPDCGENRLRLGGGSSPADGASSDPEFTNL